MPEIGLAKSCPSTDPVEVAPSTPNIAPAMPSQVWDGVPMSIYKYFNCDFFDAGDSHKEDMRVMHDYATRQGAKTDGDIMQKLEELQIRLGQPNVGETRLKQLATYARLQRNISDMLKQKRVLERGYRNF